MTATVRTVDKRYGLVLEGGGFRGAYTAGALKWLSDHDIHFDYTVTISASACYGFNYMAGKDDVSKRIAIDGVTDKRVFGLSAVLHEASIVSFRYLISKYLAETYGSSLQYLRSQEGRVEVGVFNMTRQCLEYYDQFGLDEDTWIIQAACSLPIVSRMVEINGEKFLDGGIRHMVSIDRSRETGHTRHLVIVTKDKNYVRKPNGFFTNLLLRLMYRRYPVMLETLDHRVETYYQEMNDVYELEKSGDAMLIRPSRDTGVGRFSGTREQIEEMYELGYQDMEDRREEILKFLEVK